MVSAALPTFAAMVIAVNTRVLSGDEAAAALLISSVKDIAAENSGHQFYFISNKELPAPVLINVKNIVIKQEAANPLLWKLWYNYKLPAALKKIKAEILISADAVCSLRTELPQCIVLNDIEFLHHPEWYNKRYVSFIKTNLPAFLQKAKTVITVSEWMKKEIANRYAAEENKVAVASGYSSKQYQPLSWEEKSKVKERYTGGNEYFLFSGTIHTRSNLTTLLKAFSLFKKRQKSSMQLVLLVKNMPAKNEFVESLRLYKYRNEVKLIEGLSENEIIELTASAWCAINLSPLYSDINFLQKALLCEVPAVAGNSAQCKELLKESALYANSNSIESVAEQLMLVYKDEDRYSELVENGKQLNTSKQKDELFEQIKILLNR